MKLEQNTQAPAEPQDGDIYLDEERGCYMIRHAKKWAKLDLGGFSWACSCGHGVRGPTCSKCGASLTIEKALMQK